jgi:hypothetical protein
LTAALVLATCVVIGVSLGQAKSRRLTVTFSCWATETPTVTVNKDNDHQVTAAVSEEEARNIIEQLTRQLSYGTR